MSDYITFKYDPEPGMCASITIHTPKQQHVTYQLGRFETKYFESLEQDRQEQYVLDLYAIHANSKYANTSQTHFNHGPYANKNSS